MKKFWYIWAVVLMTIVIFFNAGCSNAVKPEPGDNNSDSTKEEESAIEIQNDSKYRVYFDDCFNSYSSDDKYPIPQYLYVKKPATTVQQLPEPPVHKGYDFAGWYTEPNGNGTEFTADTEVTCDITVYAKWIPCYLVEFDGYPEFSQRVREGDLASRPEDFIDDDYGELMYWYINSYDGNIPFDFTTPITKNTNLYPKFKPYRKVCFYSWRKTEAFPNMYNYYKVLDGETISEPEDPIDYGYFFDGWYSDIDLTIPFDFSIPITSNDIYLYAKWIAKTFYSVYFRIQYQDVKDYQNIIIDTTQNVVEGDLVSKPEDPFVEGYIFKGWYTYDDQHNKISFDFTTPITKNGMIYAELVPENTFEVSVTDEPYSDISMTLEFENQLIMIITDSGYDSYKWKINGVVQSEESNILSIERSTLTNGTYIISVKVKEGENYKSAIKSFVVSSDGGIRYGI